MTETLRRNPRNRGLSSGIAGGAQAALSPEWAAFRDRLSQVLARLQDGQFLIVALKDGNRYVQFAAQADAGMRIEVTSNHYLEGKSRLSRSQMAWLRAHGWRPPTGTPARATPDKDPEGSPNYFADIAPPVEVAAVAWMAVEALVGALEVASPKALCYEAFTGNGQVLEFRELGIARFDRARQEVMRQVLEVFRGVTQIGDLELDDDGEVSLRYGTVPVYALYIEGKVRLVSVLARKLSESLTLLRRLNQFNDGPVTIRCVMRDDKVFGLSDVPASPFVPEHLAELIPVFCEGSERLAMAISSEFSGNAVAAPESTSVH